MDNLTRIEFQSSELLHMRPCSVIVNFARQIQYNKPGIQLFLSKSQKKANATSIFALSLLGIQKNDIFSLEIIGGNPEEIEGIKRLFSELVNTKLGAIHLHEPRREMIPPRGIHIRNEVEKHPEHDKFQERYNFLLRVKKFLEENNDYFCRPETLSDEEYAKAQEQSSLFATEETDMLERHSMLLYDGGDIIGYLFRENPQRDSRGDEYERVMNYSLPESLIEAQQHLGILPEEIVKNIYHNLNTILDLQSRLSSFSDGESLKSACDIALESMIPHDKADIWIASGHDFVSNYREYRLGISHYNETEMNAFKSYLKDIEDSLSFIIKNTQKFLYPTSIRTYTKNSPN